MIKIDNLVKSPKAPFPVIPAKAGIQLFQVVLDPGFRRGDASSDFLRDHQNSDDPNRIKKDDHQKRAFFAFLKI